MKQSQATRVRKLNLGCGSRYNSDSSWENADFSGRPPRVSRVNLRHRLPYKPDTFAFVYMSHVIDHFPLTRVRSLLGEIYGCLVPGGILRISVPNLEISATNYLRSLEENRADPVRHHWHTIELLDQLTRVERGGEKAKFLQSARSRLEVLSWLRPLLGHEMLRHLEVEPSSRRPIGLLKTVASAVLRRVVSFEASGERHYWMFDEVSLGYFLQQAGFRQVVRLDWNQSLNVEYLAENLDSHEGYEYKPGSLYVEAVK